MNDNSLFYCELIRNKKNTELIEKIKEYALESLKQIYIIREALGNTEEDEYAYKDALVVLSPGYKICIINLSSEVDNPFDEFCDDFVEDLGYLSDKYEYKKILGRPREWKNSLIVKKVSRDFDDTEGAMSDLSITSAEEKRKVDFLISLLIGSINNAQEIGGEYPDNILDKVKKKIILFDGEQSRFVYAKHDTKKRVTIQGLAGTGKTELLLHKLRDIYVKDKNAKIVFTCFNKILAQSMKERIPMFFNFMRVEEQIKWQERLWVMHSWGSYGDKATGLYSFICSYYGIEFHRFSYKWNFEKICDYALKELNLIDDFSCCFDYILIDESQDFPESFFELCEKVTNKSVYIAGDIFQNIYDTNIGESSKSDYLLNKCYRTDPKTLMFAHAVGMGLYEHPVIRWMDDAAWEACGYVVQRKDNKIILSRTPLRRFEDIEESGLESIRVMQSKREDMVKNVITIITEIKESNKTVQPNDIAVVFLGNSKWNYHFADELSYSIGEKFRWNTEKGYETKEKPDNSVFVSNVNNIKGLEFPFVICVANKEISANIFERNAIYMVLTRSFIVSYFVVNSSNKDFIPVYENVARDITKQGVMLLQEPSKEEQQEQENKVRIELQKQNVPVKDIVERILAQYPELSPDDKRGILRSIIELSSSRNLSDNEISTRTEQIIKGYI